MKYSKTSEYESISYDGIANEMIASFYYLITIFQKKYLVKSLPVTEIIIYFIISTSMNLTSMKNT